MNREEMMDRVMTELSYTVYGEGGHEGELELERIQCHHNFTQKERHYGKDVLVSRKGAIQAKEGQMGLIPGSMGTASYVVRGLGSVDAFETAPHGAGRRFSRTQARKRFTMDDFDRDMQGIEVRRSKEFIDELPALTRTSTPSWSSRGTLSRSCTLSARSSTSRVTETVVL